MDPPLPSELINLVLEHIPPNDIALNGRRAFRAAARHFTASTIAQCASTVSGCPTAPCSRFTINFSPL